MAARPSWRGHLRLSLVTCPVALYNAVTASGDVHFHLINPDTGNRIRMVSVDAKTEEPVERSDLVKGFEVSKGRFVTLEPEEIDAVRLESTKTIEISAFVPAEDIDRLYWDNPYYLAPDGKLAAEPFTVIRTAMEKAGKVAIGRLVMSERERLVALEPRDKGIIATTLRSHDEVRDAGAFFDDITRSRPDKEMIAIAEKILEQKAAAFDPSKFKDRYEDALRDLIKKKQKGGKIVAAEEPERSNVIDLMEALRSSLKEDRAPRKRAAATRKRPAQKRAPKKAAKRAKR